MKILFIDDDLDDYILLKEAMNAISGEDVLSYAHSGEQALRLLIDCYYHYQTFCLIILDLIMPKMNGSQLLGLIKQDDRFKDIPVIIYSTSLNLIEKERCLQLGAHAYITKPLYLNEFSEVAQSFLSFEKSNTN